MMNNRIKIIAAIVMLFTLSALSAQEMGTMPSMDHSGHNMSGASKGSMDNMQDMKKTDSKEKMGMDHSGHDMQGMKKNGSQKMDGMSGMEHSGEASKGSMDNMQGMGKDVGMRPMQGGDAPADARSPDYSEGFGFRDSPKLVLADEHNFFSLVVDRFEHVKTDDNSAIIYDLQAWFGTDYERIVLKAEGDYDDGQLQEASTELLWSHAIASYWNAQVGIRYDSSQEVPDQTWLAFGVQGLAPYWFEIDATGYLSDNGRLGFTLEAEYELLLTQKWILQPRLEIDFNSKRDTKRRVGSGLTEASFGIRLRYEIKREIAPYIGIEWADKFAGTKDFARQDGEDVSETRFVMGIRFWF